MCRTLRPAVSDQQQPEQDSKLDAAVDVADVAVDTASSACFVVELFGDIGDFCFVATAAHGDLDAPEVVVLRAYRDARLLTNPAGRLFTRTYYLLGPLPAAAVRRFPALRPPARRALVPLVRHARRSLARG